MYQKRQKCKCNFECNVTCIDDVYVPVDRLQCAIIAHNDQ